MTKLQFPALVLVMVIQTGALSCSGRKHSADQSEHGAAEKGTKKIKPGSSYNETITISSSSAVFYNPDSLQLLEIKGATDGQVFDGIMHECFYQVRNARMIMKREYPEIRIIEANHTRYILFEKANNETELIDLNEKNDPCGVFIFDGIKGPKLADMTNFESELGFYFKRDGSR